LRSNPNANYTPCCAAGCPNAGGSDSRTERRRSRAPVHTIRAAEREGLLRLLKDFRWEITGALPLAAAMVTAGGVALRECDPVSFASRKVAELYIVGETLDLAADTGGFNLQAAFTGGYLAGQHAAGG
jgi:predicted flavoprotein YhiN